MTGCPASRWSLVATCMKSRINLNASVTRRPGGVRLFSCSCFEHRCFEVVRAAVEAFALGARKSREIVKTGKFSQVQPA